MQRETYSLIDSNVIINYVLEFIVISFYTVEISIVFRGKITLK